jgi:carbonic anhydrase
MKTFKRFNTICLLLPLLAGLAFAEPAPVRTKAERDAMTPKQVLESIKSGNQRFVKGELRARDFRQEQMATKSGQNPSAIILSCIDSRAPAEIIFDKGIGEIFNARLAGNVANPDVLGSMEFACAVSGAKVILVVGHSRCGAINGAIDRVELGNLTGLLERIHPAVEEVQKTHKGPHTSADRSFQEAVTTKNVELTVEKIRRTSPLLRKMEEKGEILIRGAIYDVSTGEVVFLD